MNRKWWIEQRHVNVHKKKIEVVEDMRIDDGCSTLKTNNVCQYWSKSCKVCRLQAHLHNYRFAAIAPLPFSICTCTFLLKLYLLFQMSFGLLCLCMLLLLLLWFFLSPQFFIHLLLYCYSFCLIFICLPVFKNLLTSINISIRCENLGFCEMK